MILLLNVPFAEKDLAKSKGAKWNPVAKTWYTSDIASLNGLSKWIGNYNIICDSLYIFRMERVCWKCKEGTDVICLASDKSYSTEYGYKENLSIQLFSYVESMPDIFADYLKRKFAYFPSYSKANESTYYVNHCRYCSGIQGDNYLHEIPLESFYKKLCYKNSKAANFSTVKNQFYVPLRARLPYYDEVSSSMEMLMSHINTGVENRASLNITQKLVNGLFSVSTQSQDIVIDGI